MNPLPRKQTDMGWPIDDGSLWWYTSLPEPLLSDELARLAGATTRATDTDVVSFQPCGDPNEASQDRWVVDDWHFHDDHGMWSFRAIFDGHGGHETADYVSAALPGFVKEALAGVLARPQPPAPEDISAVLEETISKFDKRIGDALLELFSDPEATTVEDVRRVLEDGENGTRNEQIIKRCMRGTTVLVVLVDPKRENVWVVSLGDCVAVLGTKAENGEKWDARVLSFAHNGENNVEVERVRQAHPDEAECILNNRVLGAIAVTRAIGDFSFKLPAVYTDNIFLNTGAFLVPQKVRDYIRRSRTPPYVSGAPEVRHVGLGGASKVEEAFVILCSDGLVDLYEERLEVEEKLAMRWVGVVGRLYDDAKALALAQGEGDVGAEKQANENEDASESGKEKVKANCALALLRDGMGGEDSEVVSRNITVEMAERWMDDTTVLVQRLR